MAPAPRLLVEAYGPGRFRIGGRVCGAVLVYGAELRAWAGGGPEALDEAAIAWLAGADPRPDVLLIGCGARALALPPALRAALKAAGIAADAMATGPACRTFNVLAGEDRRVAAALVPV